MTAQIRFISAGAGSGKTFRLTQILREELSSGRAKPRGVLATTFTRKAAAELRERTRSHLIESGLLGLANAMGQARIGTVNSVCGQLLVRFAFEAGLPTELRVLEEEGAKDILKRAADAVAEGKSFAELLQVARRLGLDEWVYGTDERPWQTALRSLVAVARANGIDSEALRACGDANADQLLAYFDKPSATDLDKKMLNVLDAAVPVIKAGAEEGGRKNTAAYFDLITKSRVALARGQLKWSEWNKIANADPEAGLRDVAQPIKDVAAKILSHRGLHDDVRQYLRLICCLAADTLRTYAEIKKQVGAIDFVDQEQMLLEVLEIEAVRDALSEELDLLMVDEFQDTSPIQLALFTRLAACARQVVWVGDVKQAIYGFRGSDADLMSAVIKALPKLGATQEVLAKSWRSRPALVEFVNAVFGDAFKGLKRAQVELVAQRKEFAGTPAVADWILEGANKQLQWEALAAGISELMNEGIKVFDRDAPASRRVRFGDIAVLARSNASVLEIAKVLSARGIPCSTSQPGLMAKSEIVLAMACLRRLNDDNDTLATAEIVSLADCEEPEVWLSDRFAWLGSGKPEKLWKEEGREATGAGHPIVVALAELRTQNSSLSPREAVELVMTRCDLVRRVLQWQQDADTARLRLANLDRLLELASEYEDEGRATGASATLSGFIIWAQTKGERGLDDLPEPGVDAVRVMTHHAAKGLEWPVVVACDLCAAIRDRLWGVRATSPSGVDVSNPLRNRTVHYWPWPFGAQRKNPLADRVAESATGAAAQQAAEEEDKRLLYVSFTRARDVLVLARPAKALDGEWMATVSLSEWLDAAKADKLPLKGDKSTPFCRKTLDAGTATLAIRKPTGDLNWFLRPAKTSPKPPLRISPSAASGTDVRIAETVSIGTRIDTSAASDRSALGDAIHACIAADLACPGQNVSLDELGAILQRMGVGELVSASALHGQLAAIQKWIHGRWPDSEPLVEMPLLQVKQNGQQIVGRTDLLLHTEAGWILLDHKSTPQGRAQWDSVATAHGGQLLAYREAVEAVTKQPVLESWLVMPVAGAAIRLEASAKRVATHEPTLPAISEAS